MSLAKLQQLPKVIVNGIETYVWFHEYTDGESPAIELMVWEADDEYIEPYTMATVNGNFDIQDGEIAIKNYSENAGVLPALIAAGIVSPVIRRQAINFVAVDICNLLVKPENPEIDWE
jgi:hypothetical protein